MREVRFHIHRKSTFAGALLPYRMYINGQYIGTIRNGKSLDANVPKAGVYYIEDDILSSRNAVIYDNGLSEYSVVIKRAGGWRTESYNEFYMEKGNVLEQLPSFHWEKLFELQQTSVYKGYKQDKIEMRGDRAEMSDFPLYLNMVAGGLDCRDQAIGGFSFVVKIYAVPVVEIIG